MSDTFGFGIIGTGSISSWHAAGIEAHPDGKIVAVSNRTRSKAEKFAEKYRCDVEDDWRELIKRDDVQAVCICTASGLHARQSIAASEAGKHVLVEKPMAVNLKDATDMILAARDCRIPWIVLFFGGATTLGNIIGLLMKKKAMLKLLDWAEAKITKKVYLCGTIALIMGILLAIAA